MFTLKGVFFLWFVPASEHVLHNISDSIWSYSAPKTLQIWRLFGYALIHAEVQHLLCNVSVEIALGVYLERSFGRFHTVLIFGLGAVTGAIVVGVFNNNDILIGASAGVCALLAAQASRQIWFISNYYITLCAVWWITVFLLTVLMSFSVQ
ncbi:hypothetical protein L596_003778 [Steinernema carpocapsae]|uniref:Peptidase S54 rhomboid domain-containing protein n=1 Tax=Steinernema carpocapsae TaxID=34508 RepID=A0A4V6YSW7_STECR|nr:hypothetical protein L596_003778 [Steinernema carpocapsae]